MQRGGNQIHRLYAEQCNAHVRANLMEVVGEISSGCMPLPGTPLQSRPWGTPPCIQLTQAPRRSGECQGAALAQEGRNYVGGRQSTWAVLTATHDAAQKRPFQTLLIGDCVGKEEEGQTDKVADQRRLLKAVAVVATLSCKFLALHKVD